jgi:undecaprenyl-diphosphatase
LTWIEAVLLGIVQGLTEFLPVSSSGHLVLFQHWLGLTEPELLFDISVHVGTLAAVVAVFFPDLAALMKALLKLPASARCAGGWRQLMATNAEVRLIAMIIVGSVPTAVLGLLFAQVAEQLFASVTVVGITLIITGILLWFTRRKKGPGLAITGMNWGHGLLIGLVQGLAIIPGISRSGSTIATALYLGIDRQTAFRFSFLLSLPAILGAFFLGLDGEAFAGSLPMGLIFAGSFSAAVVGYVALKILLHMVISGWLYRFAPYCWIVGGLALVISIT